MSAIKIQDFINVRGALTILVDDVTTGKNWIHYSDNNTIVLIAKRNVTRMIGNDNPTLRYIAKMRFTAQGHNPLDITQALSTYETWQTMGKPDNIPPETPVYVSFGVNDYKAVDTVTFTDNTVINSSTVTFTTIIDTLDGNGGSGSQIYSQAGLFTSDESLSDGGIPNSGLFAVKNFPVLVKNSNLRFTFNWSISI